MPIFCLTDGKLLHYAASLQSPHEPFCNLHLENHMPRWCQYKTFFTALSTGKGLTLKAVNGPERNWKKSILTSQQCLCVYSVV